MVIVIASGWRGQSVPWLDEKTRDADLIAPNLARFGKQSVVFSRAYCSAVQSRSARLDDEIEQPSPWLAGLYPHAFDSSSTMLRTMFATAGYRTAAIAHGQSDEMIRLVHGKTPFYVEWTLDASSGFVERRDSAGLQLRENVQALDLDRVRGDMAAFYARTKARDKDLGILLAALDRPGLEDDTIVIFTADRGQQIGSHGVNGGISWYEETVRIPLAIRYPAVSNPALRDTLVSQVDLAPTILSLCGLTMPPTLPGRDFTALVSGKAFERSEAIYIEGAVSSQNDWRVLVRGYDKLVSFSDNREPMLFNLARDPFEQNNLVQYTADQLTLDSMLALEQTWRRKLGDGVDPSGLRTR